MLRFPLRRIKAKERLINETKRVFGRALEDFLTPMIDLRLKRNDGSWSENRFGAIYDTGASLTLLP